MTKVLIFGNVNSNLLLAQQLISKRVQALVDTQIHIFIFMFNIIILTICTDQ